MYWYKNFKFVLENHVVFTIYIYIPNPLILWHTQTWTHLRISPPYLLPHQVRYHGYPNPRVFLPSLVHLYVTSKVFYFLDNYAFPKTSYNSYLYSYLSLSHLPTKQKPLLLPKLKQRSWRESFFSPSLLKLRTFLSYPLFFIYN